MIHTEDFIPENLPKNEYVWLLAECDGTIYKVWGEGTTGDVKNYVLPVVDGSKKRVVTTVNGDYIASELKLFNF